MSDTLVHLLNRLETVVQRLEAKASSAVHDAASAVAEATSAKSASLSEYDEIVSGSYSQFSVQANSIGGVVTEVVTHVQHLIAAERHLLEFAAKHKKPTNPADIQRLVAPLSDLIGKIQALKDKNRSSPLYNHLTMISDGVPAFGWVVIEPAPTSYVSEMKESSQFYGNRIIKEYKDKDKAHLDFVQSWLKVLSDLQAYVKKNHTTGLSWNPRGEDSAGQAPVAAAPAAQPALASSAKAGTGLGNLLGDLNKGDQLTSSLRHVDKSQMTHKNPELRASSVVPAGAATPVTGRSAAPSLSNSVAAKPPKIALEGNKWVVENHVNNSNIIIDQTDLRQVVYLYNCQNSTVQIKGKVNAVTIDNCKKVGVVIENVLATLDFINCKSVQLQVTGKLPLVAVDKTDGCQIYLSKESVDVEVLTAKSTEVNILFAEEANGDFVEHAISEQLKTTISGNKLVTVPVEHKG